MDYAPLIEKRRERLAELEVQIADPELFQDRQRAGELMREHRRTQELLRDWDTLQNTLQQIEENRELAGADDPEMAELAAAELEELEPRVAKLTEQIQYSLLPRDATEDRDALVEIRAGTGGDEAALFAGDLLGMYQRYAESRGWRVEVLDASPNDIGGFKDVTARISVYITPVSAYIRYIIKLAVIRNARIMHRSRVKIFLSLLSLFLLLIQSVQLTTFAGFAPQMIEYGGNPFKCFYKSIVPVFKKFEKPSSTASISVSDIRS